MSFECNSIYSSCRSENEVEAAAEESVTAIVGEYTVDLIKERDGQSLGQQASKNMDVWSFAAEE